MRKIVFDIETRNIFQDVGSNDPTALDISVVGVYDSETNKYTTYLQEELKNLWPIIEQADVLIGYNSDHFDIPLLNKYYPGDLTKIKSVDLMKEIQLVLGRRMKLDHIAESTLGTAKSSHGLQAVAWWKQGEIDKIKEYCLDDVKITKKLYEYALKHGKVSYKDGTKKVTIKLDTSSWEKPSENSMTHTLPF